ncbi:CAP domain-containing protein [Dinghuibacter silviterrae]|uniref:Uncharacterized protein YkwD n=1 Tax=Dinghuibacter silviterrae TaxID=1539049 RepID=A0A4R8DUN1_9BACT|nr:CAP domain-containing protein [Dinghuibacter silviterrae]TDX01117.1 uncharacterized protein YkwD [Dinghuibacter silviterrae]
MQKIFVLLALCATSVSFRLAPAPAKIAPPAKIASPAKTPAPAEARIPFNEEILRYVNRFRADNGQPPLTMNNTMVETAAIHSDAMAKGTVPFGHDNFDLRFKYVSAKLGNIDAFAENVAMGVLDARQVVDGWIHSPKHRANMLGNYNLTGIAAVKAADGQIYFTQIFAHQR